MKNAKSLVCLLVLSVLGSASAQVAPKPAWKSGLKKTGYLNSPLVETTPFLFNNRLYLLENWQASFDHPEGPAGVRRAEDVVRIRDVEANKIVASPLKNHGLGTA